jgi:hypothetical protein
LVKRIVRLTLALEDQCLPIRGEVPFPTAPPFEDQLPCVREELAFARVLRTLNAKADQTAACRKQSEREEPEIHALIIEY